MTRCRLTILGSVFLACVPVALGQSIASEWAVRTGSRAAFPLGDNPEARHACGRLPPDLGHEAMERFNVDSVVGCF